MSARSLMFRHRQVERDPRSRCSITGSPLPQLRKSRSCLSQIQMANLAIHDEDPFDGVAGEYTKDQEEVFSDEYIAKPTAVSSESEWGSESGIQFFAL